MSALSTPFRAGPVSWLVPVRAGLTAGGTKG